MNRFVQVMTVACASLAMLGCMTTQPLSADPAQLQGMLKRGDKVEVVTNSGQEVKFAIDAVDETGLQGGGQHIAYNDIRSIARSQLDVGRTSLIALGVVAVGAIAASGGGGGGSSGY